MDLIVSQMIRSLFQALLFLYHVLSFYSLFW